MAAILSGTHVVCDTHTGRHAHARPPDAEQGPACLREKRPRFLGTCKLLSPRQPARTLPPETPPSRTGLGVHLLGHFSVGMWGQTPSGSSAFTPLNPNRYFRIQTPARRIFSPNPIPRLFLNYAKGPLRQPQESPDDRSCRWNYGETTRDMQTQTHVKVASGGDVPSLHSPFSPFLAFGACKGRNKSLQRNRTTDVV